jgi:peptidoglycan/LPS O-acetylase OafA/YrhL
LNVNHDSRLAELDGLRAIAALMVVLFHYCNRWWDVLPYGPAIRPAAQYGYYGVSLFFIISGFVISMSLENCPSAKVFARRRALRLLPAMFVCSMVTFLLMWWIDTPFTESQRQGWTGFISSWTFIHPRILQVFLPVDYWIDGVYWSLYEEVKFYILIAISFFFLNPLYLTPIFTALMIAGGIAHWTLLPESAPALLADQLLFPEYLPLFCAGIAFYRLYKGQGSLQIWLVLGLALALSMSVRAGIGPKIFTALLFGLFLTLIYRRGWMRWLANPILVWIGLASYPLYLLHQNIGVGMMSMVPAQIMNTWFYPIAILIAASMVVGASLVHRWIELPVQSLSRRRRKPRASAGAVAAEP